MEKLIELLNEYDKIKWDKEEPIYNWKIAIKTKIYQTYLVSTRYGFIKWLVENDKIDREKFWNSETKSSKYSDFELSYDTPREDYTNTLLMELAIQDEPIQFLIKILR